MAKRIDAGSLVCMSRRNIKGQGLVLERVKDVNLYAEFDLVDAWHKLYDRKHPEYMFHGDNNFSMLWTLRSDATQGIREQIQINNPNVEDELIKQFFSYNTAYSYQKFGAKITKLKTDFSLIKWLKAPSDYGDKPCKWHEFKQVWHPTSLIKNI
jgi:hypothetical protein